MSSSRHSGSQVTRVKSDSDAIFGIIDPSATTLVVHVTESYGGGTASAIRDYVRNAPTAKHYLVYAEREETPISARDLEPFAMSSVLPTGHVQRIKWLRAHLRTMPNAVIHAHSSLAGAYVRLAVRARVDRPIIYSPHCFAFERCDLPPLIRTGVRAAEWLLSFNTTEFAACSPRETVLCNWPISRRPVRYVPNIPPADLLPAPLQPRSRTAPLHIVAAGRIGKQKDPDFFLLAVEALRGSGQEIRASWIGGGDQKTTHRLRSNGIAVTGWQSRDAGLKLLADADVYIHTAAWEGFPIGLLEAVSLGVPSIVRSISAFDHFDLPLLLGEPFDLVSVWEQVETPSGRKAILTKCAVALRANNPSNQAQSLAKAYRLDED